MTLEQLFGLIFWQPFNAIEFAPRSAEQKSKVAEFSVSKNGRLLQPYNCVLDSLSGNLALKTRDLCFLDGDDGDIMRIVVPIR